MIFSNVSFPHPVLGLNDSILSIVKLEDPIINSLNDIYSIVLNISHDNKDLEKLINAGKAEYMCEITCTNTLYRKKIVSNTDKFDFQIPKKDLRGKVEFICLIVAKEYIYNYTNSNAHPDYAGYSFHLETGDVLAFCGEFTFNADIKYEKLKAVSSFMEIVENENPDETYSSIDLNNNKIQIQLPTELFNLYCKSTISQEEKFAPVFHSSMVLNALLIGLYNLENYKEYTWAQVIEYRLKNEKPLNEINFDDKENIPRIAKMLLGNPFERLLNGLDVIANESKINED